jgi:hypothetical protein
VEDVIFFVVAGVAAVVLVYRIVTSGRNKTG